MSFDQIFPSAVQLAGVSAALLKACLVARSHYGMSPSLVVKAAISPLARLPRLPFNPSSDGARTPQNGTHDPAARLGRPAIDAWDDQPDLHVRHRLAPMPCVTNLAARTALSALSDPTLLTVRGALRPASTADGRIASAQGTRAQLPAPPPPPRAVTILPAY